MDNIILERLEKAKIVVNEEEKVIEVFLNAGTDGEVPLKKSPNKGATSSINSNFRKWREGTIRRYLKRNGYKYGPCLEGLNTVITNTANNNEGYWKFELRTVKSVVENVTAKKQDNKNETTETTKPKTRNPRKRRAKK